MVWTELLTPLLEFLEIPKQKWNGIIEATVRASEEELAQMNRIRFSTSSQNRDSIFDSEDPKLSYASHENLLSVGRTRKIQKDSDELQARQIRWKQIKAIQDCSMVPPITEIDARPLPLDDASSAQHYLNVVFVGKPFVFLS